MKNLSAKPTDIKQEWLHVDGTDQIPVASGHANRPCARGKHKAIFTPHMDTGDFVIVTNVENPRHRQQGPPEDVFPPPGFPRRYLRNQFRKAGQVPDRVLKTLSRVMLPKGPPGYAMFKKLGATPAMPIRTPRSNRKTVTFAVIDSAPKESST